MLLPLSYSKDKYPAEITMLWEGVIDFFKTIIFMICLDQITFLGPWRCLQIERFLLGQDLLDFAGQTHKFSTLATYSNHLEYVQNYE